MYVEDVLVSHLGDCGDLVERVLQIVYKSSMLQPGDLLRVLQSTEITQITPRLVIAERIERHFAD